MNILFYCWEYPPNGSGIGRYVAEMSSALSSNGHQVIVLTSRAPGCPEREEFTNLLILRLFERAELGSIRLARLAVDIAARYHIDWIETVDHWGEGAALLRQRKRPPVVVKMHYNDVLKIPRYAQAWYPWQRFMIDLACLRQWRSIRAERYSIEHADILIAPCRRILDEARNAKLSLPARCAVVPNPIRSIANWVNAESERPTLLLVGRLDIGKGLPYLRGMLEQLVAEFPDLSLEIAGGDSYARGLGSVRTWFENNLGSMRQYVKLLGVLDTVSLNEAYRRAWVVILPSRWDTFPQAVLEAMVRAKPIVASPHGGMPEMLENSGAVIAEPSTLEFANAVAGFLSSQTRRLAAGTGGIDHAHSFYAPPIVVERYIASIKSFL